MKIFTQHTVALSLATLLLVNCSGKKADATAEPKPDAAETQNKKKKDLLTETMVKKVFGLDASVKFEAYDALKDRDKPKPAYSFRAGFMPNTITFRYAKPDAEEVKKRNEARAAKMTVKSLADGLSAMESEDVEIQLSFFSEGVTADIAKRDFADAGQLLRGGTKGMSDEDIEKRIEEERKKGTNEASLKMIREALKGGATKLSGDAAIEPIEGLGDAAEWSPRRRLLRVLHKTINFSITLDYKPDENKAKAIELAREMLKTL